MVVYATSRECNLCAESIAGSIAENIVGSMLCAELSGDYAEGIWRLH